MSDPTEPNNQIARITEVQAKYADELMSKANVVGIGVGMAKDGEEITGEAALVVLVSQKVSLEMLSEEDMINAPSRTTYPTQSLSTPST